MTWNLKGDALDQALIETALEGFVIVLVVPFQPVPIVRDIDNASGIWIRTNTVPIVRVLSWMRRNTRFLSLDAT
jgi:hypothetical protein